MFHQIAIGMLMVLGSILVIVGLVAYFRGPPSEVASGGWGSFQLNLPGAIFVIAVGAGMTGYGASIVPSAADATGPGGGETGAPSASATTPVGISTSAAFSESRVVITAPAERARVSGSTGILMEGTSQNLGTDTLWVMTKSGGAKGGQVYYLSSDALPEVDGFWSIQISGIGAGASDVGEIFTLVVVKADSACENSLENAKPNSDGDTVFDRLPAGCSAAGIRHVLKTSA